MYDIISVDEEIPAWAEDNLPEHEDYGGSVEEYNASVLQRFQVHPLSDAQDMLSSCPQKDWQQAIDALQEVNQKGTIRSQLLIPNGASPPMQIVDYTLFEHTDLLTGDTSDVAYQVSADIFGLIYRLRNSQWRLEGFPYPLDKLQFQEDRGRSRGES